MGQRMIHRVSLAAAITAALLSTGCDEAKSADAAQEKPAAAQQQAPLPVVDVWTAQAQAIEVTQNLPGRLTASREAIIVPRISGIVEKRLFNEGSMVQAGQPLYQLDNGTYRAAMLNAKAQMQSAQAALQQAKANRDLYKSTVNRYAPLVKANAISRQSYDQAVANMKVQEGNMAAAQANIAAAQAGVESAQISLGYADITAPISGVIGQSAVTEGAYVNASQTQMAKIQQLDPMYINITQSAGTLLKLKQQLQSGQVQGGTNRLQVLLEDGTPYQFAGRLLFLDQTVNENTGQVTLRAEVPNPNGDLLPGLYVRVVVPQSTYPHAYLVPQQAVTRGVQNVVMLVAQDGSYRPQVVSVTGQQGDNWIVTDGLQDGDQVIVEGLEKAGMMGAKKVQTREWVANAATQQAPQGAAQATQAAATVQAAQAQSASPADISAPESAKTDGSVGARDLTQDGKQAQ